MGRLTPERDARAGAPAIVDCTPVAAEHLGPVHRRGSRSGGRCLTSRDPARTPPERLPRTPSVFAFHAPRIRVIILNSLLPVRRSGCPLVCEPDPTEPGAVAVSTGRGRPRPEAPATYQGWHPLDERAFPALERAQELAMPSRPHDAHPSAPLEYARPIRRRARARFPGFGS
jgi:hypothetical protein